MTEKKNLWGTLPNGELDQPTPKSILKDQAKFLTEMTNGSLVGEVGKITHAYQGSLQLVSQQPSPVIVDSLKIKVPALDDYIYGVAQIEYKLPTTYPVTLTNLADPDEEAKQYLTLEEFEAGLEAVLTSEQVRNIIRILLEQAEA
ncbi:MAG: hypothetical protein AAGG51_08170 [Cyanobacteria bacterium P01_G01_bin.54]